MIYRLKIKNNDLYFVFNLFVIYSWVCKNVYLMFLLRKNVL